MKTTGMKAMILAAGKGERMRPLTDDCPKPLLKVKGKPLIEYAIENIRQAGLTDLVINISYLGEMIENYLGDGSRYGVKIRYSYEEQPLETGGGIAKAMPLLCCNNDNPFLLVSSDVWCDIKLDAVVSAFNPGMLAHLLLVKNPAHHPAGDFVLNGACVELLADGVNGYTYSGIAVIDPVLFKKFQPLREKFPLKDVLVQGIQHGKVTGQIYHGVWTDVGTSERLQSLH